MNLYILNYNNYYNRIIRKKDSLEEYLNYVVYGPIIGANFVPNDGVNTECKLGSVISLYNGSGDYLLVTDDNNNIVSRWFIIDHTRTRNGQWKAMVRRDLLADYLDDIMDADTFIEKATVNPNSPFIFNKEDIGVNQIKKKEILLENNLKTPWLVAYLAREDGEGNFNSFSGQFKSRRLANEVDYELTSIEEYPFYNWIDKQYSFNNEDLGFGFNIDWTYMLNDNYAPGRYYSLILFEEYFNEGFYSFSGGSTSNLPVLTEKAATFSDDLKGSYQTILSAYKQLETVDENGISYNSLTNIGNKNGYNILAQETGKIIKVGDKYYQVRAQYDNSFYSSQQITLAQNTELWTAIKENILFKSTNLTYNINSLNFVAGIYFANRDLNDITLTLEELEGQKDVKYDFTYDHAVTTDAVYEIIAAPLKSTSFEIEDGNIVSDGDLNLQWFQSLANSNATKVYDIQILPYIQLDTEDAKTYETVFAYDPTDIDTKYTVAFKLQQSSFSKLLPVNVTLNSNVKMGNETELWRITSPNGAASFDFNPYKNRGWDFVEVDCTLLPIQPYIKVNPMFNANGLYGGDYNDFRGLICSGDFSVSLTNSEWQTYQQQNKNFQAIFDRQIESMDIQYGLAKTQDYVGALAGVFTGAAGGALAGSYLPGMSALSGGIVGGLVSAAGGAADIYINNRLRDEAKSLTEDQWRYELGNIKARSTALAKTTSYNINNKYFPYIEYFTCTEEEKMAVANKIAYNGMTVMVIGKIKDYINNSWSYSYFEKQGVFPVIKSLPSKNYIKGQLIRLDSIDDDFHIVNSIAGELNKGAYFE